MAFFFILCKILFMASSAFMVLAVLMQESKGRGMGGLFESGTSELLGVKAKSIFKKFTIWLAAILMLSCLALNYQSHRSTGDARQASSAPSDKNP